MMSPSKYVLIFYTQDPKPPELYYNTTKGMTDMLARIVELTKQKAKFTVNEVGDCVGDFS